MAITPYTCERTIYFSFLEGGKNKWRSGVLANMGTGKLAFLFKAVYYIKVSLCVRGLPVEVIGEGIGYGLRTV
jgi:hypothetical protein